MSTARKARPLAHLADGYRGPIPVPDPETEFYWSGLAEKELRILRCEQCRHYIHYPLACCPACHSFDVAPEVVSGRATLYSFTDVQMGFVEGIEPPYVVGLVDLVEQPGLRVLSNIVDVNLDDIRIGMPLQAVFRDVAPGTTLLYFTRRFPDD